MPLKTDQKHKKQLYNFLWAIFLGFFVKIRGWN